MCKPDRVFIVFKFVIKLQCVVIFNTFASTVIILQEFVILIILREFIINLLPLNIVLEILYVFAGALPPVCDGGWVHIVGEMWIFLLKLF